MPGKQKVCNFRTRGAPFSPLFPLRPIIQKAVIHIAFEQGYPHILLRTCIIGGKAHATVDSCGPASRKGAYHTDELGKASTNIPSHGQPLSTTTANILQPDISNNKRSEWIPRQSTSCWSRSAMARLASSTRPFTRRPARLLPSRRYHTR